MASTQTTADLIQKYNALDGRRTVRLSDGKVVYPNPELGISLREMEYQ